MNSFIILTYVILQVNLARETLKGLLAHWLTKRRQRFGSQSLANGDVPSGKDISARSLTLSRVEGDVNAENDLVVYPPFEFSTAFPPSIITEGSQGGPWRKKITDLDGTEDEKDFPPWCLDCVLSNRLPPRENTKCSFYLHPCEGSAVQILTQGKLSAPRILRIHKVINYVHEKMVLDKPLDTMNSDGTFAPGLPGGQLQHPAIVGDGSFRSGLKVWQKYKPPIEISCNNQVLSPDMSLATVRAYIWKKQEDVVLNYRVLQGSGLSNVLYFVLCVDILGAVGSSRGACFGSDLIIASFVNLGIANQLPSVTEISKFSRENTEYFLGGRLYRDSELPAPKLGIYIMIEFACGYRRILTRKVKGKYGASQGKSCSIGMMSKTWNETSVR
ncbi:hypothetical protein U1Q18_044553 [Sarracenia purpurea var. burkii]